LAKKYNLTDSAFLWDVMESVGKKDRRIFFKEMKEFPYNLIIPQETNEKKTKSRKRYRIHEEIMEE
jgi:hypothetical protein